MKEAEIPFELFASGTDAGLIGSTNAILDENKKPTGDMKQWKVYSQGVKQSTLMKVLSYSIPNKHGQETVLYLQTACNPSWKWKQYTG